MLRFKQFISEGGNVKLYGDEQGNMSPTGAKSQKFPKLVHEAQPFSNEHRATLQNDVPETLSAIHDTVKFHTGAEMFGRNKEALKPTVDDKGKEVSPGAFHTGSTRMFFDKSIPHAEYKKGIKATGDIDALTDERHKEHVNTTLRSLKPGTKYGKMTLVGFSSPKGDEISGLFHHPDIPHPVQIDFTHGKYDGNQPSQEAKDSRRGGSFGDRIQGIKGKDLNMYTNAVAKVVHGMKYSPSGLKAGDAESTSIGIQRSSEVSKKLFSGSGKKINHADADSFSGMVRLTNEHIPHEQHQAIFDTFKNSLGKDAETSGKPALDHLRDNLKGLVK